jgi:ATP-dependent RNA helicase DDX23/PRP28
MGITPRAPSANGTTNGAKKVPLDIEELLAKKKAAAEAASKPRFIPKAERERLAAEKAKEEEEKLKQKEAARSSTQKWSSHDAPVVPTGPKAMRKPSGNDRLHGKGAGRDREKDKDNKKRPPPEEAEAALIRARYMGPELNVSTFSAKKKRRRTTEKKFNFEWDAEEDTSQDYNPIYAERLGPSHRLAGFGDDMTDENLRRQAEILMDRDPENGRERAQEIYAMIERRRERANRNAHALGRRWEDKTLDEMKERDWRIFKEDFGIATKGGLIPNPMRYWHESDLPSRLLDLVARADYKEPTPIQRAAIPIALQARDLIGVAKTGSGKTAAFLLPLLVYISDLPPLTEITKNDGPYALILAPTRELVQQIETEARKFTTPLGFTVVSLVGGHALEEQAFALRNGAEIIVATPGRLVDCIERRLLVLSQCCYVIMDEADRMIDMGFEEPVNKILDALPVTNEKPDTDEAENAQLMSRHIEGKDNRYRQTMMYTATMPSAVEKIAKKYLRRPAIVTVGNIGEATDTVEQRVEFVPGEDRRKKRLREILLDEGFKAPIIVFVNIKRNCDAIAKEISRMGLSVVTLHGSKTQDQREQALASVRAGNTEVLVATDLAGRGIDVPDVSLVVNFNMASSIEAYTHRIGRTGRAGKSGVAITFLGNEDTDVMYDLKQMLSKSSISRVPEELRRHEAAQSKPTRGKKFEESSNFGGKGNRN